MAGRRASKPQTALALDDIFIPAPASKPSGRAMRAPVRREKAPLLDDDIFVVPVPPFSCAYGCMGIIFDEGTDDERTEHDCYCEYWNEHPDETPF